MVDHRDLRRRHRRVVVGERKHAGTKGDRRAGIGQARDESEARCDRLSRVDEMLADEGLAIAESISEHDRFAVLAENVRIGTERRVDGLDEESELQRACMEDLLVDRHHRRRPKSKNPRHAADRGLVCATIQALAGAVLQDNDYDASLLNSATSHAAYAITEISSTRQSHRADSCPGTRPNY